MPLPEKTNIEVVLRGVEQKTGDVTRAPDRLRHAINIEFDKDGVLNKRRGYQFVDLDNVVAITPFVPDDVFIGVANFRGELVLFSYDYLCTLGSRDAAMRGDDAIVYRGLNNRCACSLDYVGTAQLTRHAEGEPGVAI